MRMPALWRLLVVLIGVMGVCSLEVRCHAAMALSKLAAVGQLGTTAGEQKALIEAMVQVITARVEASSAVSPPAGGAGAEEEAASRASRERRQVLDDLCRSAMETLSYLTLHKQAKSLLSEHDGGAWLKTVLSLAGDADHSVYGFHSFCVPVP